MFKSNNSVWQGSFILVLLVLIIGCSKNDGGPDTPPPDPRLKVLLKNTYLGGGMVDSVIAIWAVGTQSDTVVLEKKNDTLVADIGRFQAGSGKLSITVFSKMKFGGQYFSQWFWQKQVTIDPRQGLVVEGPGAFDAPEWKPRVVLKDEIGHWALVALRPDDPYFLIRDVPVGMMKIALSREYWKQGGGISKVGGGEWQCVSNCVNNAGDIVNDQFFSFLPAQIGTAPWNHIEIIVLYVMDQWGGGPVLMLTHDL